jgi:urea transporter
VLALIFLNPWAGVMALLCSAAATGAAQAFGVPKDLRQTGLYGLNGGLVGLVGTWMVPSHPHLLPMVVAVAVLSAPLTSLWVQRISIKWQLPVLTVPFLVLSWGMFLALGPAELASGVSVYDRFAWTRYLELRLAEALPGDAALFLRSMSWLLFQNSLLLGAGVLALIFWRTRVAAGLAFLGYLVGLSVMRNIGSDAGTRIPGIETVAAFNASFVAVCVGGLFLRLTWLGVLYGFMGAAAAAVLTMAMAEAWVNADVPVLNAPFLLVTLLLLALARSRSINTRPGQIEPLPLVRISTPEDSLDLRWFHNPSDPLKLSLPFYGVWYVAQGTHGLLTHWGKGSHAWDFIVVDRMNRSCRGLGRSAEDYYAWSLPVVAPAAGRVVRVLDSVKDNVPPEVNKKENWGNHIIIDHGNGLYSEMSHFRHKGIVAKEGQVVARGQLLGYLGNSGFSMEPHLHYQLQVAPTVGAKSIPAKFWGYYVHRAERSTLVEKGAPQMGELVGGEQLVLPGGPAGRWLNGHSSNGHHANGYHANGNGNGNGYHKNGHVPAVRVKLGS